jgi:GTP-binding protein EngB required for normal cell division
LTRVEHVGGILIEIMESINKSIPEFAIVGHPNEGKSSVLSTLSEDDSVRVSPTPGETTECRVFPVTIDGREIIRFIDTPGFQNPRRVLAWMRAFDGDDRQLVSAFIRTHAQDPELHDDCALLSPLEQGAGLIFVVDGSRPLRNIDRAEMEILRLTGRPRMAIINCKDEDTAYLDDWQREFRKHFNSVRLFNANRATYGQRIALLESLKAIDQQLEEVIETVIQALERDWQNRIEQTAALIVDLLRESLQYHKVVPCPPGADEKQLREKLHREFTRFVGRLERRTHQQIRRLFKHNIFYLQLPEQSILQEDLFSEKTWEFLGLTANQLIIAGALSGAALSAGLDAAVGGASLGAFAVVGGVIGAAAAALKGRDLLSGTRLLGMKLDHQRLQVGPVNNIQLLYILLDRALIYFSHVINWAHGRRDYPGKTVQASGEGEHKLGYTASWSRDERALCERFFKTLQQGDSEDRIRAAKELTALLRGKLQDLCEGGHGLSR